MSPKDLHGLLHDGVPNPPPELLAPPLANIRRRARRRRVLPSAGAAVALLVLAGVGVQFMQAGPTREPVAPGGGGPPSAFSQTGPWIFAVVGADDRSLVVVREGAHAAEPCPGTSSDDYLPLSGAVRQEADRIVLPLPEVPGQPSCYYRMRVQLDAALGARPLVNGTDNSVMPVLRERILPRPTYPAGTSRDTANINIVGNAPRPGWVVEYRADGLSITVGATWAEATPALPGSDQITAHGRVMMILALVPGSYNTVAWTDGAWQVSVSVDLADHGALTRAELQRIIDGLVWP